MFAVIFEVEPRADEWDCYLDLARMLRPELEQIEGFIENTRYRSRGRPGLLLSLSLWRDEKSVIRWRTHAAHYAGQVRGRKEILASYRLRVGEVTAMIEDGCARDLPQQRFDATEIGEAKAIRFDLWRGDGPPPAPPATVIDTDLFDGVLDAAAKNAMTTCATLNHSLPLAEARGVRSFTVRIIRDYGMLDRREAPQFHEPVAACER
jgi:heme-degrading monooxygenase HmoA